jgi:putative transposase
MSLACRRSASTAGETAGVEEKAISLPPACNLSLIERHHRWSRSRITGKYCWGDVPTQRYTVHKHRNLLANAPERLHDEITADYTDMIYADTPQEVEKATQSLLAQVAAAPCRCCQQPGGGGRSPLHLHHAATSQWKSARTTNAIERLHEEFKQRIKTQTVLPSADTAAMLFWALLASGQIIMRKVDGWQTLSQKPSAQFVDVAA